MGDIKVPNRSNWLFGGIGNDILLDKSALIESYIRYMLGQTIEMFEYDGLPETIPQKELEVRMSVYNASGSLVYNETLCCNDGIVNAQLNDKLSAGIYIVSLIGGKKNYTMRIIIK